MEAARWTSITNVRRFARFVLKKDGPWPMGRYTYRVRYVYVLIDNRPIVGVHRLEPRGQDWALRPGRLCRTSRLPAAPSYRSHLHNSPRVTKAISMQIISSSVLSECRYFQAITGQTSAAVTIYKVPRCNFVSPRIPRVLSPDPQPLTRGTSVFRSSPTIGPFGRGRGIGPVLCS